jgi:predicted ATPase/class 3 adenylate cyclase
VEISELGHASRFESAHTESVMPSGAHAPYAAPEQTGRTNRPVDWRTDLYALGAILFEMLTGQPPFSASDPVELVHRIIAVEPPSPRALAPEVPDAVAAIVLKLLAKNAEDRYQSAEGLRVDLEHALSELERTGEIAPFPLGRRDASARFSVPRKLYGRERELETLLAAFERASRSTTELVLVAGPAGAGKSWLVRELARPLALRRGRFVEGKFDQFHEERPFSALSRAFEAWVHLVLSESDAELARTRARVLEAAEDLGGLLTELVPDLELVIGPQPKVAEVSPADAQHRFQYVLGRFLRAIADETRPLVLFVDDMQWADPASLDVIGSLMRTGASSHLLVVAAFRDNEVSPSHPFALALAQWEQQRAAIARIDVGPLRASAIEALVADALGSEDRDEIAGLARFVAEQTSGNALFVAQLLRSMYEEGVLAYDAGTARWTWDEGGERAREGRDVLDLLRAKAARLPEATKQMLVRAACLGRRIDARLLAQVSGATPSDVVRALDPALREGLLVASGAGHRYIEAGVALEPGTDASYVFPHDRVQQAAYGLVPDGERALLHLTLGRRMLADAERGHARLFEIVHQLHRGRTAMTDAAERRRLAELDLEAGLLAKRSAAYVAALEYLGVGIELLDDPRGRDRGLALSLHDEAAECAYLAGQLDRMQTHIDAVLALGKNILETIRVYHLRVDAYTSLNRLNDAIAVGLEALDKLGVSMPKSAKLPHIFAGLAKTKFLLAGKDVPALATQRRMTDPKKLEAMLLLERMVPPAYMSGSMLFPLFVFAMVDLSVRYGNSPLSPFGYASFAITLSGVLGDIESGNTFGKLARDTMEELGAQVYYAKIAFVLYVFIAHWTAHLRTTTAPLLEAYRSGMKAGNLVGSTWSAYYRLLWMHFAGDPLDELEREAATYSAIFRELKQNAAHRRTEMLRQVMLNLMGRTKDPVVFGGETYADAEIATLTEKGDDATSRFFYHYNKLVLGTLFDRLPEALANGDKARTLLEAVTGLPDTPFYFFWDALARIRASETESGYRARRKLLGDAKGALAKLAKWGGFGPMNYQHKHDLVAAELARVSGETARARELFDRAIEGATRNEYPHEAALAAELAARFYAQLGSSSLASFHLRRAHEGYLRWGAVAKADALERAHPELARGGAAPSASTTAVGTSAIDLASVVKAAAAISGEIVLDRLAASILSILVENAGAQRGVLVLHDDDGRARAIAEQRAGQAQATLLGNVPLEAPGAQVVPETIVQYVARSKRPLVLADASTEPRFSRDPLVASKHVRSVLAVPIVHHGDLRGVVYLENNLAPGVFSAERVALLNVLGGQIAVSLENARLYGNLEQSLAKQVALTEAYSRFTPRAFLDFLGKESILDLRLGDQIHGDMAVLFLDIRGYTTLSESMSPDDNFRFINGFLRRIAPLIGQHRGVVNSFLGDGLMAFFRAPADALTAAIEMQRAVQAYSAERVQKGRREIQVGIGVHTGPLMIGVIGDAERMDTALVSDTVNTAARMEGLTKELGAGLIASERTVRLAREAGSDLRVRAIGDVRVKGKLEALRVYECFDGDPTELATRKEATLAEFTSGLERWRAGAFAEASVAFARVLESCPGDRTAQRYLERASALARSGAPAGWSGIEEMERK